MRSHTVLNTIQALGADVSLANGVISITGLTEGIPLNRIKSVVKRVYTLGVAPVKSLDISAQSVPLSVNLTYELKIIFPKIGYERRYLWQPPNDGQDPPTPPTGANIVTAFDTLIASDTAARVSATVANTDQLVLTSLNVDYGDFTFYINSKPFNTVVTPYTAPSGSPEQVKDLVNMKEGTSEVDSTATYTIFYIVYEDLIPAANISGVGRTTGMDHEVIVAADQTATNYQSFYDKLYQALDGSLAGGDYTGVDITGDDGS